MLLTGVEGVNNTNFSYLHSIGIEADDDGLLSLADEEKFTDALETNAIYVSDIFRQSENGIANLLDSYTKKYIRAGGTISDSKASIDDRNIRLDDRISTLEAHLEKRRIQLENEFAMLQETMALLGNQQSFLAQFIGST